MAVKKLLLVFILIPVLELFLLIKIGGLLGAWVTLALVLGLGILGMFLVKSQGLYVFRRVQGELSGGRLPGDDLLDGVLVLAGGLLLITPGFLTAGVGLALMFPGARRRIRELIKIRLLEWVSAGRWTFQFKGW